MALSDEDNSESWIYAGLVSAFPNISPSSLSTRLSDTVSPQPETDTDAPDKPLPVCQILQTSASDTSSNLLSPSDSLSTVGLHQQVMIFQYRGKFHAVDHQCPHRSFPLSRGAVHDIEDFGIVLSVGVTCQKHGWMFDVVTGESDRGPYHLGIWDVQVRSGDVDVGGDGGEVWVRKRTKQ